MKCYNNCKPFTREIGRDRKREIRKEKFLVKIFFRTLNEKALH